MKFDLIVSFTEGVPSAMFLSKTTITLALALAVGLVGAALVIAGGAAADEPATVPARSKAGIDARLTRLERDAVEKEFVQVQSELRRARVQLGLLQARSEAGGANAISEAALDKLVEKDPVVKRIRAETTKVQEDMWNVSHVLAKPAHGKKMLHRFGQERDKLQKELDKRRGELVPLFGRQLRAKARRELRARVAEQEERVAFLSRLEKALLADIHRLGKQIPARALGIEERLDLLEKQVRDLKRVLKKAGRAH
jgi:hypothetical protein